MRNLSDHRGNNLLHVLAGSGNADALAWLCSSFGPEMQDALLDENKRGLTPVVAAIQGGRLEALQFLVDHTSARDRLAPVDGDRCLLHIAAKYGKVRPISIPSHSRLGSTFNSTPKISGTLGHFGFWSILKRVSIVRPPTTTTTFHQMKTCRTGGIEEKTPLYNPRRCLKPKNSSIEERGGYTVDAECGRVCWAVSLIFS